MQPVPPPRRIPVIDALRGIALLGIVVANMRGFGSAMEVYYQPQIVWDSAVDRATHIFIDFFVTGKFLTLFALLFGVGFAIQHERALARGRTLGALYVRRMFVLLLFGAAHVLLLWWGDILLIYAAGGLLLLAFREHFEESPVLWSAMLYWAPVFFFLGFALLTLTGGAPAAEPAGPTADTIQRAADIYLRGSFQAMVAQRIADWQEFNKGGFLILARVLGLFIFGSWVWRTGLLADPEAFRRRMRPWWSRFLAAGLAGTGLYVVIVHLWTDDPIAPTPLNALAWLANSIGTPALSFVYAGAVFVCFHCHPGRRLLQPFTAVGRMALTNYILQSVIGVWIFHGWGLGWFGRVGPLPGLGLALGIYTVQVALSALWLRYFRYGPLEWLWRSLTYWRAQPVRLQS